MAHISLKLGDSITVAEDITIQIDKLDFFEGCSPLEIHDAEHELSVVRGAEPAEEELEARLRELSKVIVDSLSGLERSVRDGLLGAFVRELYYSAAAQEISEKKHRRQADGIATAKAGGARFGRPHKALPENFDECYQRWQSGELTMREAASACGMAKSSFHGAATRKERSADCAV